MPCGAAANLADSHCAAGTLVIGRAATPSTFPGCRSSSTSLSIEDLRKRPVRLRPTREHAQQRSFLPHHRSADRASRGRRGGATAKCPMAYGAAANLAGSLCAAGRLVIGRAATPSTLAGFKSSSTSLSIVDLRKRPVRLRPTREHAQQRSFLPHHRSADQASRGRSSGATAKCPMAYGAAANLAGSLCAAGRLVIGRAATPSTLAGCRSSSTSLSIEDLRKRPVRLRPTREHAQQRSFLPHHRSADRASHGRRSFEATAKCPVALQQILQTRFAQLVR